MTNPPGVNVDFEALFEAAPGIYLVLDAEFNMVAANTARLNATMTTREEVIGRNLFEVFPDNPDDAAADGVRNLLTSLERVLQTKLPDAMAVQKYDIPRPEGQGGGFEVRYWSPLNTPVLASDGEVKYIIHRVEDVTDFMALKQQEARLQSHADRVENEIYQRAKEVQEANRKFELANAELARLNSETQDLAASQQRFFSHVSHELRTPLTLILGPVEALLADRAALGSDQVRNLEVIARNARTLLRHVNDLLDVVKYRSGSTQLTYARADLSERLRVAAAHFDSASTGLAVTIELAAPAHLYAEFDVEKVDRILINLLSNAFKFSPRDGRIRCSLAGDHNHAAIAIADDGPGVAPALREAIFEPFRQGDEGLTGRASGTGLGLAIVRDFVVLHGGSIAVRDAQGGGALFECRLPLSAPPGIEVGEAAPGIDEWNFHQAVEERSAPAEPLATALVAPAPLVLIVEDNADMAHFIAQTLMPRCRIVIAADGREGLTEAGLVQPDLIVSDLMMPNMSGDQLIAALAERPILRDIPVLLLTARADQDTRIEALRQGAQDLLAKPFSAEELRARVDNLIRSKQAADLVRRGKRVSEQKYRQLMDGALDGIFILTADGVILDANRRAEEFCGCPGASLIGSHLDEALDVTNARGAKLNIDTGPVFETVAGKDDARRFFEGSSAAVAIDNESYRLLILRDVTMQRRLEAQLHRVQKLDALGQLTGGVAHDFNNLLGAVALNMEALKARLTEGSEASKIAANVERATERGQAMTRRLLAFARQQPVVPRECDLNALVTASVEMLQRALPPSIKLEVDLDPSLGSAFIDSAQFEDALLNLAINARDAMPAGGRLAFSTSSARIDTAIAGLAPAGDYVSVAVADTGAGMSEETQLRIFEPFFTTKEEGRGTGLGLSQVYGFARQAGGEVRVASAIGEGATITILLPSCKMKRR
ncbi:MAG: ATP-binding protein [Vitreimonas sp.]